jgi:signal transduction histidine kinase/CheY-like chemotaxis protein
MVKVLVVDDQDDVRNFCSRVLVRLGYDVVTAGGGLEALEVMAQSPVDLLVTDIMMPQMTGTELLGKAHALYPSLAAVVITGFADVDLAIKALRAGAHDFVTKPFGIPDLKAAVEHALGQARLAQESARFNVLGPLLELSSRRLADLDGKEWAAKVLGIAMSHTLADRGALILANDAQGYLMVSADREGDGSKLPAARILADLFSEVPKVCVRAHDELPPVLVDLCGDCQVVLQVPLRGPNSFWGGLVLAKAGQAAAFRQSDAETMEVLASQVAAFWENHRLVSQLASWNQELEGRVAERTRSLREAQERLLRSERLATVGRLGASVAHELRNPLGVINNSIYYLHTKLGDDDAKIAKHLEIIGREVGTANGIITNLMSFVRVGQIETHAAWPNELVLAALERAQIPETVHIELALGDALPPVAVDADKMQQVFLNLINNALQAMPNGGDLVVSTRAENSHVEFSFRDTGVGIPEGDQERIFEPLYTTKAKGIGLGLSIVKLLVEAHEGQITVSSQPQQGACFRVSLPLAAQAESEVVAA